MSGLTTARKRERERALQERQREKAARRAEKKVERANKPPGSPGDDPDLVGLELTADAPGGGAR